MTLEEYLKYEYADGKIDFSMRIHVWDGVVEIYIHPTNRSGTTTPTLVVTGNTVKLSPKSISNEWYQEGD